MEVFIEVFGQIKGQVLEGLYKNGTGYRIFRVYCKPSPEEDWMYFNCIANEGTPSYTLINVANLGENDRICVRGKYQQKFVWEEQVIVNPETMKKEITKMQVCKNRIYINSIYIIQKYNPKPILNTPESIDEQVNAKSISNNGKKVALQDNDNPFGG